MKIKLQSFRDSSVFVNWVTLIAIYKLQCSRKRVIRGEKGEGKLFKRKQQTLYEKNTKWFIWIYLTNCLTPLSTPHHIPCYNPVLKRKSTCLFNILIVKRFFLSMQFINKKSPKPEQKIKKLLCVFHFSVFSSPLWMRLLISSFIFLPWFVRNIK